MIIRSRSPYRVSFAGGGSDVAPYPEECGGAVVNCTINKYAWGSLELRKDNKIYLNPEIDLLKVVTKHFDLKGYNNSGGYNLSLRDDVPPRSGLGSSAASTVALIGIFNYLKRENRITDYDLAELAYKIEREELGNLGGKQDQYASIFGGLNFIEFKGKDFIRVHPLRIKKDHLLELERNLVLAFVGSREGKGGDIIKDHINGYKKNKESVVEALDRSKELAIETKSSLIRGELGKIGEILNESWEAKKEYSPFVTNKFIDNIYENAIRAGAIGGKLCGAGGGGHMIFYCNQDKVQNVKDVINELEAKVIDFSLTFDGLQTWEV